MLRFLALAALAATVAACSDAEPRPFDAGGDDVRGGDSGCVSAERSCDGACTDITSDPLNCGACGEHCDSTEECIEGACACPDGAMRCGVACIDVSASAEHCGGCGRPCGDGELCQSGSCVVECDEPLMACTGACVDTEASAVHCGECDRPCAPGANQRAECDGGVCVRTCMEDWYDLDDQRGCETECAPRTPGPEVCDGEDNDCDGRVDDDDPDYEDVACPLQEGVCAGAVARCVDGELEPCDALLYAEHAGDTPYDEVFETWCDGQDNDCSGRADEDCCTPSDLPIEVPAAELPVGYDSIVEAGIYPLDGAPTPLSVVPTIAAIGETIVGRIMLVDYPADGGHGRPTELLGATIGPDVPSETLLDAVWNDGVVLYTRNSDTEVLHRFVFETDGTQREVTDVELPEGVGRVEAARVRVLGDGSEALLIATRNPDDSSSVDFRVRSSGAWSPAGGLPGAIRAGLAIDLVPVGESDLLTACIKAPDMVDPIVCIALNSELRESDRGSVAGAFPANPPRFIPLPDGSWQLYLATEDGLGVLDTRISASGEVTQADTAYRTVEGLVRSGMLPSGEVGLLTARLLDEETIRVQTSLTVPDRAGAIVASYAGRAATPLGLVRSPEASYVVVTARGGSGEDEFSRSYALRLSRDGNALCIEE